MSFSDMQCVFTYMGMTGTFPSPVRLALLTVCDAITSGMARNLQFKKSIFIYQAGLWFSVGCAKLIGLSRLHNEYSELPIERSFFFFLESKARLRRIAE